MKVDLNFERLVEVEYYVDTVIYGSVVLACLLLMAVMLGSICHASRLKYHKLEESK